MLYDQLNQTECTAGQILKWSAVKKVHVLILFNFWKSLSILKLWLWKHIKCISHDFVSYKSDWYSWKPRISCIACWVRLFIRQNLLNYRDLSIKNVLDFLFLDISVHNTHSPPNWVTSLCFQHKELEHQLIQPNGDYNPDLPIDEQTGCIPYDSKWEFPKKRLRQGKLRTWRSSLQGQ